MKPVLGMAVLALLLCGQACSRGDLSGPAVETERKAKDTMTLRVRLGEGFKDDTVNVSIDGKQVYGRAGVSTDLTISRADSVDVQLDKDSVQIEVSVAGGPRAARSVAPAQTPFVEVRLIDGELQLLPLPAEPPML